MKSNLKVILIIFALFLCSANTFAQNIKEAFVGKWELKKVIDPNGRLLYGGANCQKEFFADNTFANSQYQYGHWLITHSGKYIVNDNEYYTEGIAKEAEGTAYALAGKIYKIKYLFSDDKKTLTIFGSVDGKNGGPGISYIETWKKVEEAATEM